MSIIHRYLSVKNKEKVLNYIVEEFGTDGFRDLLQTVVFSEYYTDSNLTICEKELLFEEYFIEGYKDAFKDSFKTIWTADLGKGYKSKVADSWKKNIDDKPKEEKVYKDRSKFILGTKKSEALDSLIDTVTKTSEAGTAAAKKSAETLDATKENVEQISKRINNKLDVVENKIDSIISSPITKGSAAAFVVLVILFVVYKIYHRIYYSACKGMHGYELKMCKIKSIKGIIKMLHDKKKHCKMADDPQKCIEKVDKAISKFKMKLFKVSK